MAILTTQWPLHLTTGQQSYNQIFYDFLMRTSPMFPAYANTMSTDGGKKDKTLVSMGDLARIPERAGPTAAMAELVNDEEWKHTLTVSEFAAKFEVPRPDWAAMSSQDKAGFPILFAESTTETLDYLASSLHRTMMTDTGPDAVSLVSDSHPLQEGNTADNKGTAALSKSALTAAVAAMGRINSPQGKVQVGFLPDMLVVPPELYAEALELTGANMLGDYSARVSDANPIKTFNLKVLQQPYFVETNDWALQLEPGRVQKGPTVLYQLQPSFVSGDNDETRLHWGNTQFTVAVGYYTWRWIWASTGGG